MNNDFQDKISSRILDMQSFSKKAIFSVSTTAKIEKQPYMTPIRNCNDFVLSGCVVFSEYDLNHLLEKIDGIFDIILVDGEKTIPTENNKRVNLSKKCFEKLKKSKVSEYKPNDLTVNATWCFLNHRFKILREKRISIVGAGNIGSKLALKLVECGAEVHLHRRNYEKGSQIVQGLNLIKPESIDSKIYFHENKKKLYVGSDILIGTSNGHPVIDAEAIKSVKKNCLIVDLGKNNLTAEALKIATQNSLEIYRTDISVSIIAHVHETISMQNNIDNSYGRKDLGFCKIVSGGYFGIYGDIVVDSINNPTQIWGVAKGNGAFKKKLNMKDISKIKKIQISLIK